MTLRLDVDLLDGDFYAGDPDPTYAELRSNTPVYHDTKNELWGISRYADIARIEKNPSLWCSSQGYRPKLPADPSMIGRDDPQHAIQRKVLFQRFTPRRVRSYEARIRATARELIGAVAERGNCDIVRDLAVPLPVITIIELIGFDRTHWEDLARWSETTNSAGAGPAYFHAGVMRAVEGFIALSEATLEARRAEPRDDALSAMLAAQRGDVPRSEGEIHMEALLLLNGGSDTTRHVIAGATLALLQHPEQCALLRRDPSRNPIAVEEFIRWVTPILNMRRTATSDTDLCDEKIREGDEVLLMYASANRDETMFADPDRFDVTRHPNPHIAFGFGTHFCLGASLARLELRVVFEELLHRLPDLRLADGFKPRWVPNAFTRGLEALPVEFSPVRASD